MKDREAQRAYNRNYMRRRREKLKRLGLCCHCAQAPARNSYCDDCREKQYERVNKKRAMRRKESIWALFSEALRAKFEAAGLKDEAIAAVQTYISWRWKKSRFKSTVP